jgi:hypothetical protein
VSVSNRYLQQSLESETLSIAGEIYRRLSYSKGHTVWTFLHITSQWNGFTAGYPVYTGHVLMLFCPSTAWRPHMSLYSGLRPKIFYALMSSIVCPMSGAFDDTIKYGGR